MTNEEVLAERLYAMKLGERHSFNWHEYIRVPGGWMVNSYVGDTSYKVAAAVFVPYNDEFNPKPAFKPNRR